MPNLSAMGARKWFCSRQLFFKAWLLGELKKSEMVFVDFRQKEILGVWIHLKSCSYRQRFLQRNLTKKLNMNSITPHFQRWSQFSWSFISINKMLALVINICILNDISLTDDRWLQFYFCNWQFGIVRICQRKIKRNH